MSWTYPQVRAALADLDKLTDSEAADALNKQTASVVRDVPCPDAKSVLLRTGEWGGLVLLSRQVPSDKVPAQLVAAAITAVETLTNSETIQATDPEAWGAAQQMLGAFVQAKAIIVASATYTFEFGDLAMAYGYVVVVFGGHTGAAVTCSAQFYRYQSFA